MDDRMRARIGGWAAIGGAVLGAAAAAFLTLVPPAVPTDRWSYPVTAEAHIALQVAFFLHHIVVAVALWLFWRAGLAGRGRAAAIGGIGSVVTMSLLAAHELVGISLAEAAYPSPETGLVEAVYGILTLTLGAFLVLFGAAASRARVLGRVNRWAVLTVGVYVFVPLTPALFAGFLWGRLAIGVWFLAYAWVGIAMLRWAAVGAPAVRRSTNMVAA